MSAPVVNAEGLYFGYGPRRVIDGVDLAVGEGEVFGVVGADGAGKSTLLRLLLGHLAPSAGKIVLLGEHPAHPDSPV